MATLHRLEDGLLALGSLTMVVAAVAQILLRNVWGLSLLWVDPLVRLLVLWGGLLGAVTAVRENKHIRIQAGLHLLGAQGRRRTEGLADLAAAIICAVLAVIAVRFVCDEHAFGGIALLGLATWQVQLVFPLAFALMALRFGYRALASRRPCAGPERRAREHHG